MKSLAQNTFDLLLEKWPQAQCELNYSNPFELLIATILSAQTTDIIVNKVTPHLFSEYPTAKALSQAQQSHIEEIIKSTGFYKNKAKNIISCSQKIVGVFNQNIPKNIKDLTSLPGVGRKTANVVLGNAFNINHGFVVDTHVKRCAKRIGLTHKEKPDQIEKELIKQIDQSTWTKFSHLLIFLGRRICLAKNPQCSLCPLNAICESSGIDL